MRIFHCFRLAMLGVTAAGILAAQGAATPPLIWQYPIPVDPPKPPAQAGQQGAQQPAPQPGQVTGTQPQRLASTQGFLLGGVPLREMIETLGKMMKLNFIID